MPLTYNGLLVVVLAQHRSTGLDRLLDAINAPFGQILVLDPSTSEDTDAFCRARDVQSLSVAGGMSFGQVFVVACDAARSRSAAFLLLIDGDAMCRPTLVSELMSEMLSDPGLAIVSPAIAVTDRSGRTNEAQRSGWDFRHGRLGLDPTVIDPAPTRLEADYCHLACALLRLSALEAVGDGITSPDRLGFSAELGIRLRDAGYACASLPGSRVILAPIDPALETANGVASIRALSAHRLRLNNPRADDTSSWGRVKRNLRGELDRCGGLDLAAPWLSFAHPGLRPFDVLYSVWETDKLPGGWVEFKDRYRAVFVASAWNAGVFRSAGFRNVHHVPLGVDTDIFHPWGASERIFDETTFLWFAHNQHRKGLDVCLEAWRLFRCERPSARLIVMGTVLQRAFNREHTAASHRGPFVVFERPQDGISVWELVAPLSDAEIAAIYRSVDVVLSTARSEGFGFVTAESLACGTLSIFADYGATREFAYPGAPMFGGRLTSADYADMGFSDVGRWWEPDVGDVVARMREAYDLGERGRREVGLAGMRVIRRTYTWRNTASALRAGMAAAEGRAGTKRTRSITRAGSERRPEARVDLWKDTGRETWFGIVNRAAIATRSFRGTWRSGGPRAALWIIGSQLISFGRKRLRRR
jgi:glycosyltransferase involved in cell wall biosynthesis